MEKDLEGIAKAELEKELTNYKVALIKQSLRAIAALNEEILTCKNRMEEESKNIEKIKKIDKIPANGFGYMPA
jgi:hypothetical protein